MEVSEEEVPDHTVVALVLMLHRGLQIQEVVLEVVELQMPVLLEVQV